MSCGTPTPVHDARRADGPGADTYLHGVNAPLYEGLGSLRGGYVPRNELRVRKRLPRTTDGLQNALRVAMRGIDHDRVDARLDERPGPLQVRARGNRPPRPLVVDRARLCTRSGASAS